MTTARWRKACCRRRLRSKRPSRASVGRVHVISCKLPDSLLLEVFTNEGTGTLVIENIDTLSAEEQDPGVQT